MNRAVLQSLQMLFVLLDLVVLNFICLIKHGDALTELDKDQAVRYAGYFLLSNGLWVAAAVVGRLYACEVVADARRFMENTAKPYLVWLLLAFTYSCFLHPSTPFREFTLQVGIYFAGGLLVNRLVYLLVRQRIESSTHLKRKILIVGHNAFSSMLASALEQEDFSVEVVGFVSDTGSTYAGPITRPLYVGLENVVALSRRLRVDEIFSTIMPEQHNGVYALMKEAEKALIRVRLAPVRLVTNLSQFVNAPVHVEYLRNIPILNQRKEPLEDAYGRVLKRTFDIVVSLVAVVFVLSWLVPLLGLLIRLDSPGPLFFVQLRSGKNNRPFGCYKFRSMRLNEDADMQQARRNDARLTRIGRFIRKTSLDEFPQFFNVLKGDMSVVGPRPHMLRHTTHFAEIQDHYMVRQLQKPGITGWAQVNGARGEVIQLTDIQNRVKHDLWYLENWRLWLDVRIVFMTVFNIFKGEENAF